MLGMRTRTLSIVAAFLVLAGGLSAAVDPQLMSLVMPDAQVLAGVNVQQARNTPFGQFVIGQMQMNDEAMKTLLAAGFDPARDVREFLLASTGGPGSHTGLALAAGQFDLVKIRLLAAAAGAKQETYKGVTIYPGGKNGGVAFLNSAIALAGDLQSVRDAIDRRTSPAALPAAVAVKVNRLSGAQDAWVLTLVPPASLHPHVPSGPAHGAIGSDAFQKIDQASAGVKFGTEAVMTAEAVAQSAADAGAMADVIRFLANMTQLQSTKDPKAAALARNLKVSTSGATLNVNLSIPEADLEQLAKPRPRSATRRQ